MSATQMIFQCNRDCPRIKIEGATGGAIVPQKLNLSLDKLIAKAKKVGYLPEFWNNPCMYPNFNGIGGESGDCLLKGGKNKTLWDQQAKSRGSMETRGQ